MDGTSAPHDEKRSVSKARSQHPSRRRTASIRIRLGRSCSRAWIRHPHHLSPQTWAISGAILIFFEHHQRSSTTTIIRTINIPTTPLFLLHHPIPPRRSPPPSASFPPLRSMPAPGQVPQDDNFISPTPFDSPANCNELGSLFEQVGREGGMTLESNRTLSLVS